MLGRFALLLGLCLLSLVAYLWPQLLPAGAADPFLRSRPYLNWLIAATMLAIGWMLPRDEIEAVLRRWPTVLGGTLIQYGSMPLLAFAVAHTFRLDATSTLGLVMAGCVPGAMASNVLTLLARGNVSYSVSLTTTATLTSPAIVPVALWLALGTEIPPRKLLQMSLTLCALVVIPVVVGYVMGRTLPAWRRIARWIGPPIANGVILWIIAVVVAVNRERIGQTSLLLLSALLTLNLLGYLAGYFGARALRLPEGMRRALTLEVGTQNAGLGTVLVLSQFADQEAAAIPTALYAFGCMFTGTVLALSWSKREAALPEAGQRHT